MERIASLSCWSGPVSWEPLSGGITNQNFLVQDGDERFVVRVCEERPDLGIERRNERICQSAASRAGVAPRVAHFEPGILVTQFIDAVTLKPEQIRDSTKVREIAATLQRLHQSHDRMTGEMLFFCPFQTIRTYTETARGVAAPLPRDIDQLLDEVTEWFHELSAYKPTLCHNDLLAANILDDGGRLWLVDWEYAGAGNPLFDLASVSANSQFGDELERELIHAYWKSPPSTAMRELHLLKTASLLREGLWAVIQLVNSKLEFDYQQYADEQFDGFRTARSQLA